MKRESAVFRVESHVRSVNAATERALERGLNRVAIHWHGEARQRAPVDTGRLMSSIAFSAPGTNPFVMLEGGGGFQPPAVRGLEAMVGTNVEYAPTVHELHRDKSHFIEAPGKENSGHYQGIIREELANAFPHGLAADD